MSTAETKDRRGETVADDPTAPPQEPRNANDAEPPKAPVNGEAAAAAKRPAARKAAATDVVARASVRVTFTAIAEWLGELAGDADLVEERIVRVTERRTPPGTGSGMQTVEVVAGYVVRGQVVECAEIAGTVWTADDATSKATEDQRGRLIQGVELTAQELGLTVRGGRFGPL